MVGMPRPSPPHGHPPNAAYSRHGHDYHHQTPRHVGSIPPHFNERSGRPFAGYSPPHAPHSSHAVSHPHRQSDDHMAQYPPVFRRAPPPSPRAETAPGPGPEGSQHIHAPPASVRRSSQFPYGQGFYEYGDYNRSLPSSGSHSPTMRRPSISLREGEVVRRFVPRPMQPQGQDNPHQYMMPVERHMPRKHMGMPDLPNRHTESWRATESFDNDHSHGLGPGPSRHMGNLSNSPPNDDHNLSSHPLQQSPPYRTPNPDRVFRPPPSLRPGHLYEQANINVRHMSFDRSPHKNENREDELSRSNEENSSTGKEDTAQNLGCTCKKSKCLKLYCQCFASSQMCVATCRCISCKNIPKFAMERTEAIHSIMMRNPNAFDTKFKATSEGKSSKVTHKLGCKCRKSACLKKYCECYHAEVKCSSNCRCIGCQNMPTSGPPGPYSRKNNFIPGAMMDAARDLAGLKTGSPIKHSSSTAIQQLKQQPQPQPQTQLLESSARSGPCNQDLYQVPSLTTSGTPSKEDESFSDDNRYPHNKEQTGESNNPDHTPTTKPTLSDEKQSSPVDILLSAAYALTELGSASTSISINKNTNINTTINTPATPSHGNKIAWISPSPKRKMSDVNYHDTPSSQPPIPNEMPYKRNRLMIPPGTSEWSSSDHRRMSTRKHDVRERLGDEIESESA